MRDRARGWAIAGLVLAAGAPCASAHAQAQLPLQLELRVPKPPTLVRTADGPALAYELHVTNLTAAPVTLDAVEVLHGGAPDRVVHRLADSLLAPSLARPGVTVPAAERSRIGPGLRAVAFLWVPADTADLPPTLRHRVRLQVGSGDSVRTHVLEGRAVPVTRRAVRIGPPLRGGPWLVGNGPAPRTGHRRAVIATDGVPTVAQRFAIDYVKLTDANATFSGDRLDNRSYGAEGEEALAVADGRVVATKDSIPENVPGVNSRAVPITLETVGGNFVIIDIGGGHYAFYAHLQPGSLRVRVGDQVRRGQVVGLVGNSGNSTEPHLHFHIADAPTPLGSEGVPYEHDEHEVVGRCRGIGVGCTRTAPATRRHEIPLANTIVNFPPARPR